MKNPAYTQTKTQETEKARERIGQNKYETRSMQQIGI